MTRCTEWKAETRRGGAIIPLQHSKQYQSDHGKHSPPLQATPLSAMAETLTEHGTYPLRRYIFQRTLDQLDQQCQSKNVNEGSHDMALLALVANGRTLFRNVLRQEMMRCSTLRYRVTISWTLDFAIAATSELGTVADQAHPLRPICRRADCYVPKPWKTFTD